MSIRNYVRPQLTIKQLLDRTPDRVGDHINALVIGAEYFLNIYNEAPIPGVTYSAEAGTQDLLFTYFDELETTQSLDHSDYEVDEDSIAVFAEDLEAVIAEFIADGVTDGNQFTAAGSDYVKLSLKAVGSGSGDPYVRGGSLAGELDGREVKIGDKVRITDADGVKRKRSVVGFASSTDDAQQLNQLILDGPVVGAGYVDGTELAVEIFLTWSGELQDFTYDSGAVPPVVTLNSGQSLTVTDKDTQTVPFTDNVGKVFLSYRALEEPDAGEGILEVKSVTDIRDKLGTISLHNDLAFAVNEALSGSQGKPIKVLRVESDDVDGFTEALRKTESTDMVYALSPITTDFAAIEAVVQHSETMSNEVNKKFRRVYFGTDSPGDFVKASKDTEGSPIVIDIDQAGGSGPLTQVTTESAGINFLAMGLVKGDYIVNGADEYAIEEVLDETTLLLETPVGAALTDQSGVVFWKADTPKSQIEYVSDLSKSLGSRRAANIWTEGGTRILGGETRRIPNRFVAAEIAGLRSALLPQQGLTRTEINSITDAPEMYIRYTPDMLDEVAASGVFIILQEVENGDVFIRHQLTTDVSSGSLYYEDSVGTNIDDISYEIKDTLDGYIGRRNVNAETILEIRGKMFGILKNKTLTETSDTSNIGPALIGFDGLTVEADDILKDKVNVYAQAFVPLPLNNIAVTLQGSVAVNI